MHGSVALARVGAKAVTFHDGPAYRLREMIRHRISDLIPHLPPVALEHVVVRERHEPLVFEKSEVPVEAVVAHVVFLSDGFRGRQGVFGVQARVVVVAGGHRGALQEVPRDDFAVIQFYAAETIWLDVLQVAQRVADVNHRLQSVALPVGPPRTGRQLVPPLRRQQDDPLPILRVPLATRPRRRGTYVVSQGYQRSHDPFQVGFVGLLRPVDFALERQSRHVLHRYERRSNMFHDLEKVIRAFLVLPILSATARVCLATESRGEHHSSGKK